MRAWGVTTCTASPPFLRRLAGHAAGLGLRRILTGGAPVSDDDLARWYAAFPGAEIVVVYGSTEAEPVAHVDGRERLAASREQPPAAPGCCLGRPVPNVRVRIVGISSSPLRLGPDGWAGIEMPDGQIGEFVVAGPHVCRDYYRNPAAVAANKILEPGGGVWHRMGDTGCRDGSGRLWLAGRVHSTVWRAGRPVHPLLVEQAALAPGIRQAACVGAPDPALGERAVLVLSGDALPTETEVRARLREAGVEADEVVFTRRPLPVDPRHNAKVDYAALREMLPRLRKR
jgi:acyl-CoA synthetase (AMP-forming)/AMP-acid ligase II